MDTNLGLPDDQTRFLISMIISFPLGYINHFIHGYFIRLLYSIIIGLVLQYYFFKNEILETVLCLVGNIIIIKFSDPKKSGLFCTIFSFIHLSYLNLKIIIYDYGSWKMDITTICMMNLCKHSAYAYNYQDTVEITENSDIEESVKTRRKINSVKEFKILEYIGYIYFYPTALMGPFLEFSDYINFIKEENDYQYIPKLKCFLDSLKSIIYAVLFGAIYVIFKNYSSVNFYFNNLDFANNNDSQKFLNFFSLKEFKNPSEISFYHKIIFYSLLMFQKYKYFVAFFLSEGCCIASGVAYNKNDDKNNKIKNIEISVIENFLSVNISKFFQNWNISVHNWLKNYIFLRIYKKSQDYKDLSKMQKAKNYTFIISAFWHGFYPCYYIVFGHFALCLSIERNLFYIIKNYPILMKNKSESSKISSNEDRINNNKIDGRENSEKNYDNNFNHIKKLFSFTILFCMSYNYAIMESLTITETFITMKNFYFIPSIVIISLYKISGRYASILKNNLKRYEISGSRDICKGKNCDKNSIKKEN